MHESVGVSTQRCRCEWPFKVGTHYSYKRPINLRAAGTGRVYRPLLPVRGTVSAVARSAAPAH